jgi:hypothetical protein
MDQGKSFEMRSYYNRSEDSLVKTRDVTVKATPDELHFEPAPPTRTDNWTSIMDRFWLLETISLFVSFGALAGLVGLLKAYDNRPLPQWSTSGTFQVRDRFTRNYSLSVTLNSVLSLIATVFKICLGFPVAASLGQLKWDWFADGHKLADFQLFDSARGVLGSLTLLWTLRAR